MILASGNRNIKWNCHHLPPQMCLWRPDSHLSSYITTDKPQLGEPVEGCCWPLWARRLIVLCLQGFQPPRHPSSPRTLKALTLTLTRCLATTPMPTTWSLQVSFTLLPPVFVIALPPPSALFGCSFILCYTRCEWGTVNKIHTSMFDGSSVTVLDPCGCHTGINNHTTGLQYPQIAVFNAPWWVWEGKERCSTLTGLRAAHSLTASDLLIYFFLLFLVLG